MGGFCTVIGLRGVKKMVKWATVLVPDCSANTHRWIREPNAQRCVICGVIIKVVIDA